MNVHGIQSLAIATLATTACVAAAQAQTPAETAGTSGSTCPDPRYLEAPAIYTTRADFLRLAEIGSRAPSSPSMVRRRSAAPVVEICGEVPWTEPLLGAAPALDPWLRVLPVRSGSVVNTGYRSDRNNGVLWAGRGLSTEVSGGLAGRWGVFSAAVTPQVAYQANSEYPLSPLGQNGIDLPQRMGSDAFIRIDPGQSYARVDAYGAAVGVSNENLWLGPGLHSSILLSSTAPGFPHAFVGTSGPADIGIGRLTAEAFWGRLEESFVFDDDPDNDHRLLAGLVVGFEPRWVPGLYLGAARLSQQYISNDGLALRDYVPFFEGIFQPALDESDKFLTLYFRWVLPESGVELFGEWAKFDGNTDLHDALVEPDNGRTYLFGLQKVLDLGPRWLRLHGEIANLSPTLPILHRATTAGVYRHSVIRQGHTQRGQLLGAWTGPGSDYQIAGGDLLASWGGVGLFAERVRRNMDVYYSTRSLRGDSATRYDVELTAGTRGVYFWRGLEIGGGLAYSHRLNRDFLPPRPDEVDRGYRVDSNWQLRLEATWHPGSGQRTLIGRESPGDAAGR